MSVRTSLGLACTAIVSVALAPCARAQEINYGALSAMFGEPVTTSATGSPQKASQTPANLQIITADDIRRSGATDIPDILRYYAGIDVRTEGALDNDVSIRGYGQPYNPRLLVLINGRQVYLDDYGYTAWQNLPVQLADIRQIEIVRGPASALFGFNAASGVINIITYDPLFDKTNVLNFGIGTHGTYTGSLVSTLNEPGKGGITVQLGGIKTDEFNQSAISYSPPPDASRPYAGNYAVDARFKPTDNTEVTLETTKSVSNASYEGSIFNYSTQSYRIESYKAGISADTQLGLISLLGYTNEAETTYHSSASSTPENDNNQIYVIQLNDLFKIANAHAIRLGLEYRNNRGSGLLFAGTLHYNNFAADAMWNWQISPSLSFTAAGRIDHLEIERDDPLSSADIYTPADYNASNFTTPSYNVGVVWQPTANDTFRFLTGRAVQAPSLLDLGFDIQIPEGPISVVVAGNPNLKPSISTNYEIDYDRQISPIHSILRTAIYYNISQDFMANASGLPGHFADGAYQFYSENTGNGQAAGGEMGLSGSNDAGFRWNASYSLVSVRNKTPFGPPSAPANFNNATPTSAIDFGGGYSWHQWETDAEAHWQSNYENNIYSATATGTVYTPVAVANYITASARIGYTVNSHVILAVAGQALTQANQNGFGAPQPYRRVLFSATFTY